MTALALTTDLGYLIGGAFVTVFGLGLAGVVGLARTSAARDRARAIAFDRHMARTPGLVDHTRRGVRS